MARSKEQFLCLGDEICFFDEDGNALSVEDPLETRACARRVGAPMSTEQQRQQQQDQTLPLEAIGTRIFRIEPQQSYSERRALEQFIGSEDERDSLYYEGSPDELIELSVLEAKAAKERAQNETERRRVHGNAVLYGEVVQLYNAHFKKYLTVTGKPCRSDASHLQVNLSNEVVGYFRIVPRYRIRVDGEPVRLGDTVALQCLRPEGFLNVGSRVLHSPAFNTDYYEVYTHTRIASWTFRCHRSARAGHDPEAAKYINSAQYVRFYHKEMEAYLESPVLQRDKHGVRLRKHIINPLDPKESDSPLAFWEIENVNPSDGSKIQWKKPIRIRHAASRAYLHIDPNSVSIDMNTQKISYSFRLIRNPRCIDGNDGTLFKFVPVSDPSRSGVPFGSYVRIQHVLTKCWMHAATETELRSSSLSPTPVALTLTPDPTDTTDNSQPSLSQQHPNQQQQQQQQQPTRFFSTDSSSADDQIQSSTSATGSPISKISASQEFHYHDCFSITLVDNQLSDTFNIVNELLPQLQCFLMQSRPVSDGTIGSRFPISDEEHILITDILQILIEFCTDSRELDPALRVGLPIKYHQSLLRDIGIIETIIAMIRVPFDLSKRYETRASLQCGPIHQPQHQTEHAVSVGSLLDNSEPHLKSIVSLCYNLLRVFLISGGEDDDYNDPSNVVENQWHVIHVAGDTGVELFMRHLTCGVGATDFLVRLISNNSGIVDFLCNMRPQHNTVGILLDQAFDKSRRMMVDWSGDEDQYEAASSIELLSTLCRDDTLTQHHNYITTRVFDPPFLLETRMEDGRVQVRILDQDDEAWHSLTELVMDKPALSNMLHSILQLICSVSLGATPKVMDYARQCIPKDICLKCIGDITLPDRVRAKFCDLLRVLYIDVQPFSNVILSDFSMEYEKLDDSDDYPGCGIGHSESDTPKFFERLKHWLLVFLDDKCHQFTANRDEVEFLGSALKMVQTQLRLGFFTDAGDMKRLFRALILVLDGRTDARNEEHLKSIKSDAARRWYDAIWELRKQCSNLHHNLRKERFNLTEETQPVMNTKILILEIFDLIYDLRLRVRMNKLAFKWKNMETQVDNQLQHSPRLVLTQIFQDTMLRQRENSLMPILKDILKYKYAPLKRIAAIVMHRIYNDCEDMFNKAPQVLLLSQPQQVFVYHGVKKRLTQLRSLLFGGEQLEPNQLQNIDHILYDFIDLFRGKTIDYDGTMVELEDNDASQRNVYSKIFTNLNAHAIVIELLLSLKAVDNKHAGSTSSLPSSLDGFDGDYNNDYEVVHINVLKTCLEFLEELIKQDKDLQSQLVLTNVDLLLDIGGIHSTLARSLYNVFGSNLYVSIRIKERHIKRILEQSHGVQSEYLHLLTALIKAQGKLLKKHQDCVMRLIMDNREFYVPFKSPSELVASKQYIDYYVALVDLLAVCGQGDNAFGQSFARTIFCIHDVFVIVQDDDVHRSLKAAMLRFLASTYLDNPDVLSHISNSDDQCIRALMQWSYDEMSDFLRSTERNDMEIEYIYNGILVFLRPLFEHSLSVEMTVDEMLCVLCPRLIDKVVELMMVPGCSGNDDDTGRKRLQNTLACLDSMINVAGFRGTVIDPTELRSRLRAAMVELTNQTKASVRPLDSMNAKFQGFIRALIAHKDVKSLMQTEFKQLGSHFNLSSRGSDQDVKSLVEYLSMTTNIRHHDPREEYQVATINLLEEIPLQYIRERSSISHSDDPVQYEVLEKKKIHAQNTLNRLGCTLVAQNLLSSPRRQIFEAALKLLIALLEGGNKNVQDNLEDYFYSIREERFFYSFHHRLQSGIASLKEAQQHLLRAAYKMNRQQSILGSNLPTKRANSMESMIPFAVSSRRKQQQQQEQQATNKKKRQHQRHRSSLDVTRMHMRKRLLGHHHQVSKNAESSPMVYQKISNLMASETAEFGTTSEDFQGMKDTMRALQLMVEGHNINLQLYLARQPDNIKSFNIVQDVVEYLHTIVPICNIQNVRLIIQVLDTITELAQGCVENQRTIFAGKILNPANTILRERYTNCPSTLIEELKSKVVTCLLSLLEGGIENSESIFREMSGSLDLSVIVHNMNAIYDKNADQINSPHAYEKLNSGFQYCILLMTLWPALDENQRTMLDGNRAFEFFQSHTGKIEVVMESHQEKQLSRVLFPIPEVCKYLREDTKQRFLWNVKRDSPSAKIEDFVQLSDNIIYEIENHAKVARSQYLSFLTGYSTWWWRASYGVTLLLNLLILSCSESILIVDGVTGAYCSRFKNMARLLLGTFHLLFWTLSTAEFFFIELPILVNRHNTGIKVSSTAIMQPGARQANITTSIGGSSNNITSALLGKLSQTTGGLMDTRFIVASLCEHSFLYHLIMLVFSVFGLYNPGFYSVHLLDFAFRDRILQGVIASITLNVNSITRTGLLAIIVVYIHSVIAYMFFRFEFDMTKGLHCSTLTKCFVTVLSHGVRSGGGIGDILEPDTAQEPRGWRTAFEMSFFLLVVVFLLNAIFGIIFDTFGHLRDERSAVQHDMKDSCFICSIPSVEFQRHAKKGFDNHVKHDHNIWQYLFFMVHLKNKDRTEYTGPESYVSECLKEANYSFFPINRALCLHQNEDDDGERLEKLEELTQSLIQKVNAMEEHIEKIAETQSRSRSNSLMLSPM